MNYSNQNPLLQNASYQKQQLLNDFNNENGNNPYPTFSSPNTNINQDGSNNYNQEIYVHNSLNEPIMTSLMRDLTRIYSKLKVVALPVSSEAKHKELKQWDLWGPFIICLFLGIILCFTSRKNSGLVFSMIFIIMWIGAMVITMNSSLLGGKLTLMQCICLLGYCTFPCVVASIFNRIILKFMPAIGKVCIVFISFVWSTKGKFYYLFINIYFFYSFYSLYCSHMLGIFNIAIHNMWNLNIFFFH